MDVMLLVLMLAAVAMGYGLIKWGAKWVGIATMIVAFGILILGGFELVFNVSGGMFRQILENAYVISITSGYALGTALGWLF